MDGGIIQETIELVEIETQNGRLELPTVEFEALFTEFLETAQEENNNLQKMNVLDVAQLFFLGGMLAQHLRDSAILSFPPAN